MSKVGKERVPAGPGGSCLDTTHCPGASPSLGFPSWSQFPSLSNAAEGLPASDLEPRRNAAQPTEPLRLRTPAAGEPPEGQPAGQARSGPRGCARLIPALRPRLDTPRRCYGSAVPPPPPRGGRSGEPGCGGCQGNQGCLLRARLALGGASSGVARVPQALAAERRWSPGGQGRLPGLRPCSIFRIAPVPLDIPASRLPGLPPKGRGSQGLSNWGRRQLSQHSPNCPAVQCHFF